LEAVERVKAKAEMLTLYLDGRLEGYPHTHPIGKGSPFHFFLSPLLAGIGPMLISKAAPMGDFAGAAAGVMGSAALSIGLLGSLTALKELLHLPPAEELGEVKALLAEMDRALKGETRHGLRLPMGEVVLGERRKKVVRKGKVVEERELVVARNLPYAMEGPYAFLVFSRKEERGEVEEELVAKLPYLFTGREVVFLTVQGLRGGRERARWVGRRLKRALFNALHKDWPVWMMSPAYNTYMAEAVAGMWPWGIYRRLFSSEERSIWIHSVVVGGLMKRAFGTTDVERAIERLEGKAGAFLRNKAERGLILTTPGRGEQEGFLKVKVAPLKVKKGKKVVVNA